MFEQVIAAGDERGQLGKGLLASIGLHAALLGVVLLVTPGKPMRQVEPTLIFVPPRGRIASNSRAQPAANAAASHGKRRHRPKVGKRILPTEQAAADSEVDLSDELPDDAGPAGADTPVIGGIATQGPGAGTAGFGGTVDFDASGTMTAPRLIEGSAPGYTADALRAGVEGTVTARCVITAQGTLEDCRITNGLPFLDRAVLGALRGQRYTPVTFQGHPVAVNYDFTFRFVLPR